MSHAPATTYTRGQLRQRAVSQLTLGIPTQPKRAGPTEALAVLHQLASSPSTAGDALALLHEMQVHQVELELQQEELHSTRSELEAALARQSALVERAPVGFLTIDSSTVLLEVNLAGARLLGAAPEDLLGRPLTRLLPEPSADVLHAMLERARAGLPPDTCELGLLPLAGVARTVHATVGRDTTPGSFVLVLMAAVLPAN